MGKFINDMEISSLLDGNNRLCCCPASFAVSSDQTLLRDV
ncbi:MAG: hypothetical protein ACI8ZB_001796 [Desulforhopalus sp.]|jgi:hypothetical protein